MIKYIVAIATISFAGLAGAANLSGASQGYLNFEQQQMVRNCIQACGQDGNCQAQCIAAGQPQQNQPQQYQPQQNQPQPPPLRTDFKCVSDCTAKGYQYQLCRQRCSY